ncbi:hypothetical protein BT96DRAFT_247410 [Gymnopus androsaceus JB14]|uniref:F-box domain-containing protein n=1 Tax=Gymnopus androsaceus JB14 TaxID=1447944 RepID=A0A6A4IQP1_9AGAR|nr:hypothetical protein BT96DRAFT_247410 [Gymnopus androsaceus JB14]
MLPEELLHHIAEFLAYDNSCDGIERELPEIHYKHATQEIRSLSLASRRLRRISLPFLFAFVRIKLVTGMRNFRDQCLANPDFAGSVRTLQVSRIHNLEGSDILRQLLPRLRNLAWVHLYSLNTDVALFIALADQINVKTVFVESLPSLSDVPLFKVNKFLLHSAQIQCPGIRVLEPHLRHGMQVAQLVIYRPGLLQDEFGLQRFPGLREINIIMGWEPVP